MASAKVAFPPIAAGADFEPANLPKQLSKLIVDYRLLIEGATGLTAVKVGLRHAHPTVPDCAWLQSPRQSRGF